MPDANGVLTIRENWYLDGQLAGQAGLLEDACPYPKKRWAPREAWLEGWHHGKLICEAMADEDRPPPKKPPTAVAAATPDPKRPAIQRLMEAVYRVRG